MKARKEGVKLKGLMNGLDGVRGVGVDSGYLGFCEMLKTIFFKK
jgi:hypothetical protein